ncbi:hypothetical protein ASPTUDRAFT_548651 [Aspergillus tubingensis CBS 134.48]|uniref:Uncharacterized protein n=1 Tax=Aspergillus tubingensis (strain CBS 134.48) TaxID=767770 RepID=A0A1L9N6P1_ASPTC|nr:hypothetical protein ASPTUDRAFT_548651 [Aspergillus tubingensis CBS 134.48]
MQVMPGFAWARSRRFGMYRLDREVSHRFLCCALYQVSPSGFCLPGILMRVSLLLLLSVCLCHQEDRHGTIWTLCHRDGETNIWRKGRSDSTTTPMVTTTTITITIITKELATRMNEAQTNESHWKVIMDGRGK